MNADGKQVSPDLVPRHMLRLVGVVLVVTLLGYLGALLVRALGWSRQDPLLFVWYGVSYAAVFSGLVGWLRWGIWRRKHSDGALFGRHSRIGATFDNDVYVYILIAGAVAMSADGNVPSDSWPVVASTVMTCLFWTEFARPEPFTRLAASLGRSFLALLGVIVFSFVPRTVMDLMRGSHSPWGSLAFLLFSLFIGIVLPVYAANAHADEAWLAAHEHSGDPST